MACYGYYYEVGDRVTLKVDPETRNWSPKDRYPFTDGEEGIILSSGEHGIYFRDRRGNKDHGVYAVTSNGVKVYLPKTGRVIDLSWQNVDHVDKAKEEAADAKDKAAFKEFGPDRGREKRISDLPETAFWEGDRVMLQSKYGDPDDNGEVVVQMIDYHLLHEKRNDGSPMPIYAFKHPKGWTCSAEESELTLIERGPMWNYYHGVPNVFASLVEEANFAKLVGCVEQMRNPKADNSYSWTMKEALDAMRNGEVDAVNTEGGLFGAGPSLSVYKLDDPELGARVRAHTLAGFANYDESTDELSKAALERREQRRRWKEERMRDGAP